MLCNLVIFVFYSYFDEIAVFRISQKGFTSFRFLWVMAVVESFEHFPHKFDHDDPHSSAEILISRFRPDLVEKLKDDHLCVEVVSGGYTNKLLVLYFESDPSEKILLRIYGEDTENFIDRDREINLLRTLYKHKCSGEVYGIFGNGMCYEYVPGETLTADMAKDPHVTTLIIQKLVQLHCIDREQGNLPEISLFDKMDSMLRWVPKQYANSVTQENFDQLNLPTVDQLGAEVELLRTHLDRAENFSPLVFCHNDLFYGNIIYEEDSDRLHFIDFEYAGINHQVRKKNCALHRPRGLQIALDHVIRRSPLAHRDLLLYVNPR